MVARRQPPGRLRLRPGAVQDDHHWRYGQAGRTGQSVSGSARGFAAEPRSAVLVELSYTQPLLQGGGWAVNRVPIVLARIEAEKSYFQFKDSVQEMVRGVIEGYWSLVAARTDVWARQRQVEQAQFAYDRRKRRSKSGSTTPAWRPRRACRCSISARRWWRPRTPCWTARRRCAISWACRPWTASASFPSRRRPRSASSSQWTTLLELAEERRPDMMELKLIVEADQQLLLQARNEAYPQLDAVGLYRWNGLEGELPDGTYLRSQPGQFTDWTLGVNFSVPLGLRRGRAALRSQELVIARDRANLQQGLHAVTHDLAQNLRSLDRAWEQYDLRSRRGTPHD